MLKVFTLAISAIILSTSALGGYSEYISMSKYYQKQNKWCWAAVSQAVRKNNTGVFRYQCKMASAIHTSNSSTYCCGENYRWEKNSYNTDTHWNRKSQCDQPYNTGKALKWNGVYQKTISGPASGSSIAKQLSYNYPVVVSIRWDSGRGHAMVVYGASVGGIAGTSYNLWNPSRSRGAETINHSSLRRYRGGNWRYTYFTN